MEGPAEPLVALLGADAALPCRLVPARSAAHMRVRWLRARPARLVLAHPGAEQPLEYRGRAELVRDAVGQGAVALRLRHVRASDDGQYRCQFQDGDVSREATAELRVVGALPRRGAPGPAAGRGDGRGTSARCARRRAGSCFPAGRPRPLPCSLSTGGGRASTFRPEDPGRLTDQCWLG